MGPAPIENDRHGEEFKFFSNCDNINGIHLKFLKFMSFGCARSLLLQGFLFSCGEGGLHSSCGMWSRGTWVHRLQQLQHMGLTVVAPRV